MSMITKFARVGDEVVMQMDKEARSWGRAGVPDGTKGIVTGHYRYVSCIEPFGYSLRSHSKAGIWEKNGALIVQWENGETNNVGDDAKFVDMVEYERRYQELWVQPVHRQKTKSMTDAERELENWIWIGELPKTEFEVGDHVTAIFSNKREHFLISRIEHRYLLEGAMRRVDGSEMPIYDGRFANDDGTDARSGSTALHQNDQRIELVKRGNIWKHLNGETITFKDIADEANFHRLMCWYDEVRNPANGFYQWDTLEDCLEGIRNGTADGFYMSSLFGGPQRHNMIRFDDREFGKRIAAQIAKDMKELLDQIKPL